MRTVLNSEARTGARERSDEDAEARVRSEAWLSDDSLPLVVFPGRPGLGALDWMPAVRACAERQLARAGSILFRGFKVPGPAGFRAFARAFGAVSWEDGLPELDSSDARLRVSLGGQASGWCAPRLAFRNHGSCGARWPMKLWLYCELPRPELLIADNREVYRRLHASVRGRLLERGLMYVRNYEPSDGTSGLSWSTAFGTQDRAHVEARCRACGIACEWKRGGGLRTRQLGKAIAAHPSTRVLLWFNQAHLFHRSTLEAPSQEALAHGRLEDFPYGAFYADGTPIEVGLIDEIHSVYEECAIRLPWEPGDILMLDNMLTAHAFAARPGELTMLATEPYALDAALA